MDALQRVVNAAGGQAALASAIGVTQQRVWNWINRGTSIPAEYCVDIERAFPNEARRWDLRPKDWHRIWPELIDSPGSPATSADVGSSGEPLYFEGESDLDD